MKTYMSVLQHCMLHALEKSYSNVISNVHTRANRKQGCRQQELKITIKLRNNRWPNENITHFNVVSSVTICKIFTVFVLTDSVSPSLTHLTLVICVALASYCNCLSQNTMLWALHCFAAVAILTKKCTFGDWAERMHIRYEQQTRGICIATSETSSPLHVRVTYVQFGWNKAVSQWTFSLWFSTFARLQIN